MNTCTVAILLAQIFTVVWIVAAANSCKKDHRCGPNEKWDECGSPCVRDCNNRWAKIRCVDVCAPGCYCEYGYIRKYEAGPCIREFDCPLKLWYRNRNLRCTPK